MRIQVPEWINRKVVAWSFYDFADTSFSALFVTFFYPILIRQYLGGTEFQIGIVFALSLLATALLVPFIGAVSDAMGRRMPILIISTAITAVLTALTGYAGLTAALMLGVLANLFNNLDIDLYDSYIPDLAEPRNRGRLSGFGVAVGYLGTLAALVMAYLLLSKIGFGTKEGVQAIFPATAAFYLLFSIPMFIWVRDLPRQHRPLLPSVRIGVAQLRDTLTNIKQHRGLGPFLLSSFLYNDAMHTSIIFLSLFSTIYIGLTIQQFFAAFAIMAVAAFVGGLVFGSMSDRFRPRRTLAVVLLLWIAAIALLMIFRNWQGLMIAGSLGGALLGGVWAINRHMVSILAPPDKIAQIYGIEGLTEKTAGVIGPIGFGFLASRFGYIEGLAFLLVLLAVALVILLRGVPEDL